MLIEPPLQLKRVSLFKGGWEEVVKKEKSKQLKCNQGTNKSGGFLIRCYGVIFFFKKMQNDSPSPKFCWKFIPIFAESL